MTVNETIKANLRARTTDLHKFEKDLSETLALTGGSVSQKKLDKLLTQYLGHEAAAYLQGLITRDLNFFRDEDPASREYTDPEILSVRRGMTAIAAHRIFRTMLDTSPDLIYDVEVIAKAVQRNTNVEIHPLARIASPFGIDHGLGPIYEA